MSDEFAAMFEGSGVHPIRSMTSREEAFSTTTAQRR